MTTMTMTLPPQSISLPSTRTLLATTVAAMALAGVVLITIVLPAEYGIDPLGTGRALGLTPLAGVVDPPPADGEQLTVSEALTPEIAGPVGHYATAYRTDAIKFVLGPYEYVEYKYRLAEDATMIYSWAADGGLLHDFHGDRDGAQADASQSFDKQPRRGANGSFTAPFTGIHGWYWENPGGDTITVTLSSAGFYVSAVEIRLDKSRHPRELAPVRMH